MKSTKVECGCRWKMMNEHFTSLMGFGIFVGLVALVLWARDRIFYPPMTSEQSAEHARRYRERLAYPDFEAVEGHFGHALPDVLKRLYGDSQELSRGDFEVFPPDKGGDDDGWYVAFYEPIDAEALQHTFHDPDVYLSFANDGCGNAYIIDPREPDPAVFFHFHETGEIESFAESMSEFMNWPKRPVED